jgi:hypothetical protein
MLALTAVLRWKDRNFPVLSKLCEACTVLAKGFGSLSMRGVLDELAGATGMGPASEMLSTLAWLWLL